MPDPSEALAIDPTTSTVYAMTERDSGDEGVDPDVAVIGANSAVTAAECGEDSHDIEAFDARTGAVKGFITVSGEAEYMAVDTGLHKLYVSQYNDESPSAPQCLAVVDLPTSAVTYYSIPFTFTYPDGTKTDYQYDPTGIAVDQKTHVAYIGGKMPEIETEGGDAGGDIEWGIGAIMAFDGVNNEFVNTFVPAGDDPESLAFNGKAGKAGRVYAANEDEGTLTITSAITRDAVTGVLNTTAFRGGTFTYGPIFKASECPDGTYQPAEADKLAVNERTNMVYLTDDRFRVAMIPGDVRQSDVLLDASILRLSPGGTCPTSPDPEVYNYANNVVVDPTLGSATGTAGGKAGLLYVTSENDLVSIVDLKTFVVTQKHVAGAGHIDWPVIDMQTMPHKFFVSDEQLNVVHIYTIGYR